MPEEIEPTSPYKQKCHAAELAPNRARTKTDMVKLRVLPSEKELLIKLAGGNGRLSAFLREKLGLLESEGKL